jgi:hypothetical protein
VACPGSPWTNASTGDAAEWAVAGRVHVVTQHRIYRAELKCILVVPTFQGSTTIRFADEYVRSSYGLTARTYSEMTRSAHSTRETKMAGLRNFAFRFARSFSETPRAREQAPQAKTGMCLATTFSRNSLSGGQPMGITASEVALRIR